jgi:hypothetical protein
VIGCETWDATTLGQGTYAASINFPRPDFEYSYSSAGSCRVNNYGGGYGCQCVDDKPAMVNLWKEFVGTSDLCLPFKENSPFQCTKTEVTSKSSLEILSLSIANTQLLFGVLTAFCAYIFYKMKKNTEISPAGEAGWQEAAEKLEKSLREEFQQALKKKADKSEQQTV